MSHIAATSGVRSHRVGFRRHEESQSASRAARQYGYANQGAASLDHRLLSLILLNEASKQAHPLVAYLTCRKSRYMKLLPTQFSQILVVCLVGRLVSDEGKGRGKKPGIKRYSR